MKSLVSDWITEHRSADQQPQRCESHAGTVNSRISAVRWPFALAIYAVTASVVAQMPSLLPEQLRQVSLRAFAHDTATSIAAPGVVGGPVAAGIGSNSESFNPLLFAKNSDLLSSIDARLWLPERHPLNNGDQLGRVTGAYTGVGFPHIETSRRPAEVRYKPYKSLISLIDQDPNNAVANVFCMGLKPAAVARRAAKYEGLILDLAVKHRVSASLVKAVVTKESCFNQQARSHVGAIGLMQLMPATAQWLKVDRPDVAEQNLAAGIRYLATLHRRFGTNELALAAYNAGPANVDRYNGVPPFAETQNYVKHVMHFYRGYVAATRYSIAQNDAVW